MLVAAPVPRVRLRPLRFHATLAPRLTAALVALLPMKTVPTTPPVAERVRTSPLIMFQTPLTLKPALETTTMVATVVPRVLEVLRVPPALRFNTPAPVWPTTSIAPVALVTARLPALATVTVLASPLFAPRRKLPNAVLTNPPLVMTSAPTGAKSPAWTFVTPPCATTVRR